MLDFDAQAVGPIRLGDSPEAARALGAPKKVRGGRGNETHEYDGFELEFHEGRLVCAKFDIEEPTRVPIGDWHLSRATKPLDVRVWFGEPSSDSTGGANLRWVDYERGGATLAFEFDATGLDCVQLYAEGYA
jgi:hypothetical protein